MSWLPEFIYRVFSFVPCLHLMKCGVQNLVRSACMTVLDTRCYSAVWTKNIKYVIYIGKRWFSGFYFFFSWWRKAKLEIKVSMDFLFWQTLCLVRKFKFPWFGPAYSPKRRALDFVSRGVCRAFRRRCSSGVWGGISALNLRPLRFLFFWCLTMTTIKTA